MVHCGIRPSREFQKGRPVGGGLCFVLVTLLGMEEGKDNGAKRKKKEPNLEKD